MNVLIFINIKELLNLNRFLEELSCIRIFRYICYSKLLTTKARVRRS